MTSPSEPVESREQPSAEELLSWAIFRLKCGAEAWAKDDAERAQAVKDAQHVLASIRNLETLRDVHRRTIDDLISEAQTAGATIDGLRADLAATQSVGVRALGAFDDMRDARDAALAEVSRLREQGARMRLWARELKQDAAEHAGQSEAYVFAEGLADRLLAMTAETTPLAVREGE